MRLAVGERLGSHEVLGPIGAGGMGEVYRARDTRLGRQIAIKSLPIEFANDPDRIARFEREAQALAALQHPNIGGIHELLEHGGQRFLVLELVEGETLAARIARGPVPVDEAIPVLRQVAQGLEAAHDRGIVHRDLKPANVMIGPDGTAKILDFGLAKALDAAAPGGPDSAVGDHAPTVTSPAMTERGVVMGTAAYMSPEQARGRAVDRRADIWAFGCVAYELLVGSRAFPGDTVSDTIGAVLRGEPDWSRIPADTPDTLRRLMDLCLRKDPQKRLPHMGMVRLQFDEPEPAVARPTTTGTARVIGALAIVGMAGIAAGAGVARLRPLAEAPAGTVRFEVSSPEGSTRLGHNRNTRGTNTPAPHLAASPNGRMLAFVALKPDGSATLWVRPIESLVATELPNTSDASFPFWSPDSRHIAYFANGRLTRIDVDSGAQADICAAELGEGGTWGLNGTILFAPTNQSAIFRVAASGGAPESVTALAPTEVAHNWPTFLPDGRKFIYTAYTRDAGTVRLREVESGVEVRVTEATSRVMAVAGHLLFVRNGQLLAQPFDASSGRLTGDAGLIADSVGFNNANTRAGYHASESGVLVHRKAQATPRTLVWLNRAGVVQAEVAPPDGYRRFALSPDESSVVVEMATGLALSGPTAPTDLWLLDLRRGVRTRLTTDPGYEYSPVWSRDGREIFFGQSTLEQRTRGTLWRVRPDAGRAPTQVDTTPIGSSLFGISPDGGRVSAASGANSNDVTLVPVDGSPAKPLFEASYAESDAVFSPDGLWVAYTSDEAGPVDVYLQPWPPTGRKWRISTGGGATIRWTRNGTELFYGNGRGQLMAVSVRAGTSGPVIGEPVPLFSIPGALGVGFGGVAPYDVTGDGTRFLVAQPIQSVANLPLIVTMNWPALVPRR